MKNLLPILVLTTFLVFLDSLSFGQQHLYLAAGNQLTVFAIDSDSGKLQKQSSVDLDGAGPFVFSKDGTRMYAAATKDSQPQIATLERHDDGNLKLIKVAPSGSRPGYLDLDQTESFLAGNHYRNGTVTTWKLEKGVFNGERVQEMKLEPKAHAAKFSADNRWLLVPATGPNKVFISKFDSTSGKLMPNDPPFAEGPQGEASAREPRHLIFHPEIPTVIYTTNERLSPGVGVWKWDTANGTMKPIQNIVTQPKDDDAMITTATLHLTPDNRFLYLSNRSREGQSSIVGFRVDAQTGKLSLIGHTPCESFPRAFCLGQNGKFVYVAGQRDMRLGVYRINSNSGQLTKIEQHVVGKNPIWVRSR